MLVTLINADLEGVLKLQWWHKNHQFIAVWNQ